MGQKKSSPLKPLLIGCGCLTIIAVGITALFGASLLGAGWFVASNAEEIIESAEQLADEQVERAKAGARDKAGSFDLSEWGEEPLTRADVDAHVAFVKAWQESDEVAQMREGVEGFKKGANAKDPSTMDKLEIANSMRKVAVSQAGLKKLYDELAEKHGGSDVVMKRYVRIVALVAAANDMGGVLKKDPHSKPVASALVAQHADWKAKHAAWLESVGRDVERYKKLGEEGGLPTPTEQDQEQIKADIEVKKPYLETPGLLLLGATPDASLSMWKGLPGATRKDLVEKYASLPVTAMTAIVPDALTNPKGIARALLNSQMAALGVEKGLQ